MFVLTYFPIKPVQSASCNRIKKNINLPLLRHEEGKMTLGCFLPRCLAGVFFRFLATLKFGCILVLFCVGMEAAHADAILNFGSGADGSST